VARLKIQNYPLDTCAIWIWGPCSEHDTTNLIASGRDLPVTSPAFKCHQCSKQSHRSRLVDLVSFGVHAHLSYLSLQKFSLPRLCHMHTASKPPTFEIIVFLYVTQITFVDKDKDISENSVASIVTILSEDGSSRFLRNVCVTFRTKVVANNWTSLLVTTLTVVTDLSAATFHVLTSILQKPADRSLLPDTLVRIYQPTWPHIPTPEH
jgi:uncharacterized membrane protein